MRDDGSLQIFIKTLPVKALFGTNWYSVDSMFVPSKVKTDCLYGGDEQITNPPVYMEMLLLQIVMGYKTEFTLVK